MRTAGEMRVAMRASRSARQPGADSQTRDVRGDARIFLSSPARRRTLLGSPARERTPAPCPGGRPPFR